MYWQLQNIRSTRTSVTVTDTRAPAFLQKMTIQFSSLTLQLTKTDLLQSNLLLVAVLLVPPHAPLLLLPWLVREPRSRNYPSILPSLLSSFLPSSPPLFLFPFQYRANNGNTTFKKVLVDAKQASNPAIELDEVYYYQTYLFSSFPSSPPPPSPLPSLFLHSPPYSIHIFMTEAYILLIVVCNCQQLEYAPWFPPQLQPASPRDHRATNRLTDKYVISLLLTLVQRADFSTMPDTKSTYSYPS